MQPSNWFLGVALLFLAIISLIIIQQTTPHAASAEAMNTNCPTPTATVTREPSPTPEPLANQTVTTSTSTSASSPCAYLPFIQRGIGVCPTATVNPVPTQLATATPEALAFSNHKPCVTVTPWPTPHASPTPVGNR